jgi:cephalosporin-C deacetylase-like acetyl esterase
VQQECVATEGGSQGGYFAIATAMLEPRIRCVAANVLAFSDYPDGMALATAGHHTQFRKLLAQETTSSEMAAKSLAYTDGVNLITRVKAPVQISMGGVDPVCNYICGIVAINRIPEGVEKDFRIYPKAAHEVPEEMRAGNREWYTRWLKSDLKAQE